MPAPLVVHTVAELREHVARARRAGQTIGLVPTMGALHAGHVSLVERSQRECGYTVATIFVNPLQFGPQEDYTRYPRTLESDCAKLATASCDLVFAPNVAEVYPRGPQHARATYVEVTGVTEMLEGASRPGHFRGVATVVLKLFNMAAPDVAYFGQKDYQQATLIRQMTADLNLPLEIRVCPIVREPDGLAMSSRNVYLSPAERQQALTLSRALAAARQAVASGERDATRVLAAMRAVFAAEPAVQLEYTALVDPETLVDVPHLKSTVVALVAARVGTTRLIDNELLAP